jgi:predicted transcriptional regulator
MIARRSKMQIYIDILKILQTSKGRMLKTHIVYKANLTHVRLKEYLLFLVTNGFIEEKSSGRESFFTLTEKGTKFLESIVKLRKISNAFGIPL